MNNVMANNAAGLTASLVDLPAIEVSLIHLQAEVTRATKALEEARVVHRMIWGQYTLTMLETKRLEHVANADAFPDHQEHHLAEALKLATAATILRS